MSTCDVTKGRDGKLRGATEEDDARFRRIKKRMSDLEIGEVAELSFDVPRQGKLHRKFFKLLDVIFPNQERYASKLEFRHWLALRIGWVEVFEIDGQIVRVPKTMRPTEMGQLDLEALYPVALDVLAEMWPGLDDAEVERITTTVQEFA